jgi:hypothetical protein
MGTPPASGSLDQMRNVQRSAGRGAWSATRDADVFGEIWNECGGVTKGITVAATAMIGCTFEALSLANGVEGRFCWFCDCTQQHLFAQQPI